MKLITLNFKRWHNGASNGEWLSRIYKRIYYRGYWTPLVTVEIRRLPKRNNL